MLIVLAGVLLNTTPVQNFIARQTTAWLSKKLKSKVTIEQVRIDFLNHVALKGLYIEDNAHDTLLYAGEARIRITDWFFFKDKLVLHYLSLENTYVHIYRTAISKEWNYGFIEKAFESNDTTKSDGGKPITFDFEKVSLANVRFHMDDAWGGEDLDFDVGNMQLDAKGLDLKKKIIDINSIQFKNVLVAVNEYAAGHPKIIYPDNYVEPIDTTPFNTGKWRVNIKKIDMEQSGFNLTMDDKIPVPDLFDENHLIIKNIKTSVTDITIIGDTIRGQVNSLYAKERCGITIKNMRSKVTVSPVASICDELLLETNYSKVQDYYAMHYSRFPSFLEYIDSVVMVGRLKNSTVDTRDIAYFAPEMKSLPAVLKATGDGGGTVSDLKVDHILITDGNTVAKGNLTMKGLPDIYTTYITYTNGEIYTNGNGVLRYAPELKNSPNIALEKITHAYFKGKYEGFIENFMVSGTLLTNLGSLNTNMKMYMPGFKSATANYSGTMATDNLELGLLLRQASLGTVTSNGEISGHSFDVDDAQMSIKGIIKEISINGYSYHNVNADGILGKKQFNGNLLVDDPNLALDFSGGLDYTERKNIKINATAHLLYSNLKALNLTTDSATTSADFDLNCTGSNIDNFFGYARLYNIDLKRNGHKVAVDSIYLNSAILADGKKELTIQSNDVSAYIKGSYQLSKLVPSTQYYLSKYIPNYINAPVTYPPDQNLEFTVKTRNIDSILAVSFQGVSGFDTSTLSGSLNTTEKKLSLNINIPYATIGRFHMYNIAINGLGDFDKVALGTTISNVVIGDSLINSSLSLTTTLANDSLNFVVATTSPDSGSSITLNGQIIARKDSLFLSILPSQFFLNRAKWDIAGGSKVVYSSNYLQVENINLTSGLQKITAGTQLQTNEQSLLITTENLDLAQFGYWAGLSEYQPEGRLNGTITIDKIFKQLYVSANMKATNVKMGADTVGMINLIGSYDGAKKLISLDPQTGIYRDNASVVASGNISFDSLTQQKLDGNIEFNNANVTWASPFLVGIFSHLSGIVNGSVNFRGTSYEPVISGTLGLLNGALKLDYMGCSYTIPSATVKVDNRRISFGKVDIFDVYNNFATLTGYFSHNLFKDMKMHLTLASPQFEVMRLTSNDNNLFYGNLVASMDSFTVRGPFNNIKLHAYNAAPAGKSHIFIPVSSSGDISTYSFVTFKSYGKNQEIVKRPKRFKLAVNIDANFNELAEMTIVLDPVAGDAITARGGGNIQLSVPPDNDMRITGQYAISEGTYDFTFKTLEYRRQFILNQGSTINFTGPFFETGLDVDATYSKKARLYDLLSDVETSNTSLMSDAEKADSRAPQTVNVLMHMRGTLTSPLLTFNLDLPEKRSIGTYAYTKFTRIDQDERQKIEQVGSLLLIGSFIPSDGLANGSVAGTVALNNFGQLLSGQASAGITNLVNKLTGDDKLNVDVKYNTYNLNDLTPGSTYSRNSVKVGLSHPFLNDRLIVEVGSTSDWGRPASAANSTSTNFNITGDFRLQYLLTQTNGLRLNAFRTSDYDVTAEKNITRGGVGISWRKSFDGLGEFFRSKKYADKLKQEELKRIYADDTSNAPQKTSGTQ